MTLLGQYLAALNLAIAMSETSAAEASAEEAQGCDVYLMPLGGGVFNNSSCDIKRAMNAAYSILQDGLNERGITVYVLTWKGNSKERTTYQPS